MPLNSGPGIGIIGRRLLGSVAGLELFPLGFRTSTYFLAVERERERIRLQFPKHKLISNVEKVAPHTGKYN